MAERIKEGKSVEAIVQKERSRKEKLSPNFRPGVLGALGVVLARVMGKAVTGQEDTEAGYEQSIPAKISVEQAINYCRKDGIKTKTIVNALIGPAAVRPIAFGDLKPAAIEGIRARFAQEINDLFWHRK